MFVIFEGDEPLEGEPVETASLADLVNDNAEDEALCTTLAALRIREEIVEGGGAAPLVTIRRIR